MTQDSNHELSEQQSGSLVAGGNRMWFHLSNTQAEISTVALLHNRFAAACKSETSPTATQRTLTKCPRHPIIRPGGDSPLGGTRERQQTLDMLADQAHTCQKEP
ncbi:MAG: hypothetical protein A2Z77_08015 [Chloroflexi bacterium RBG_13_51_36]|nr:MAG: hypothetical protein A2Z77_08015 [Chloroflexi bacterium RBG_13_51_36]